MKLKIIFFIFLSASLLFPNTLKSQERAPMSVIFINEIPLSQSVEYEDATKKQAGLMKKYNYPFPFYIFKTADNFYYWITPVNNFSELEDIYGEWFKLVPLMLKNDGFNHEKAYGGSVNYMQPVMNYWSEELSYFPETPRFDYSEKHYIRWYFVNVHYGQQKSFLEKHKRYIAEFNKHKPISGFETYIGSIGCETPFFVWMERYKNPQDLIETRKEIFEKLGPEVFEIWNEMKKDIRKMETKTGWYLPDLSYIPKN